MLEVNYRTTRLGCKIVDPLITTEDCVTFGVDPVEEAQHNLACAKRRMQYHGWPGSPLVKTTSPPRIPEPRFDYKGCAVKSFNELFLVSRE